ncbi:zn 2cys6 transcription factor [Diplodia corticola]|uniref:Zn 2cys6 transcription factor n=1 Tax=Diplodia corticola TaxID=236234 RepID=A0A1J9QMC0_9PEZI|nr:zn 2cys6 transcription factor [Diplodia corticola]OJD29632.1 zn 2cys6 transcription factor [Diplodia corticola]
MSPWPDRNLQVQQRAAAVFCLPPDPGDMCIRETDEDSADQKVNLRTPSHRWTLTCLRYLTQVEHQLAEARALVQQYASAPFAIREALAQPDGEIAPQVTASSSSDTFTVASDHSDEHTPNGKAQKPSSSKAITFPLEPTPASVSGNLEWDERSVARSRTQADGMGNLANGGNEGYLGVASGASFLHLTQVGQPIESEQTEDPALPNVPQQTLPPSRLDSFIDDYFTIYHPSYPIIHEATFRAEYMEVIPRPAGTLWHVLLYVVSALGACISGKYPSGTDAALFEAAKSRLSFDILETGSMMLVQVLVLVANYVQKANKPNSGYNYLGLAKRVAVGIGLHREYSDWAVTPWQMEMRRRVWWGLVIFDTGASITFSRPIDSPTGVDVGLPRNFRDTDLTRASSQFPDEAAETTVYTNLRCQALFNMAIQDIFAALISGNYPSPEVLLQLDDSRIGGWLAHLPPYFNEHAPQVPKFALCHAILHLRCRNFKIIMYRPFVMRSAMLRNTARAARTRQESEDEQSQRMDPSSPINLGIRRCLQAAAETITTTSALWFAEGAFSNAANNRTPMACWYGIYFVFQAVIIPVVSLRNEPQSGQAEGWRRQVRQAVRTLEDMAHVNPTAARCLRVIARLCGPFLLGDEVIATEESPQTQLNDLNSLLWPLDSTQFGYEAVPGDGGITDFFNQLPGFQWE